MKSSKWYVHFPGDTYALGPIYFEKEVGEKTVRNYIRNLYKLKRLPNNTEIWVAS